MIPFKLFYITYSTPDLEKLSKWYQDILGYRVYVSKEFPQFETRLCILEKDGFWLELIEQKGSQPPSPLRQDPPHHTAIHGVSQVVYLVDDLATKTAELESLGVKPVWEKRVDKDLTISFQIFRDCDGNFIQFAQLMPEAIEHFRQMNFQKI